MGLITNLQQTVADLIIRVSDHDSDASTITSNEQRKQRIPHLQSKSSMRRLHLSNAGTVGHINVPPDPGEIHRYIGFPLLENQNEATPMHQEEASSDAAQHPTQQSIEHQDEMSPSEDQVHDDSECIERYDDDTTMTGNAKATKTNTFEVNGGIDDDNLLAMMASDAKAVYNTAVTDSSHDGPHRDTPEQC